MTELDHASAAQAASARATVPAGRSATGEGADQGKLPVRERVAQRSIPDSFCEEGLLASWERDGLGAEGVVTGVGTMREPSWR